MRYKCITSYDGTNFYGFQVQNNLRTVQNEIEKALLSICKRDIRIHPAGRTDSGVHALGQVFHFDSNIKIEPRNMKKAINSLLSSDIYIKDVETVSNDFHARYDAKSKVYKYLIDLNEYNPLKNNYCYNYNYKINIDKIVDVSKIFIGNHDFKAFTKNHKMTNTIRNIYSIDFEVVNNLITITFHGDGFLHNMIRIIVAMLLEVGRGKITKNELIDVLESCDRRRAPKLAPASGLYLYEVEY